MTTLAERAAAIRLLVLDVDGVLTDGRLYYSPQGEEMKVFHVRDGAGMVQLQRAGVQIAVISGRNSVAVQRRMHELGIKIVEQGIDDKAAALARVLAATQLSVETLACVGDDFPDLPLLTRAHLAIAVADAHELARAAAHHVTRAPGGSGAVREVCDLILKSKAARSA